MEPEIVRTYLITGANRGLGAALRDELIRRGDYVIACARNLPETRAAGRVRWERLDIENDASIRELGTRLHGVAIDVLVNNAGIAPHGAGGDRRGSAFTTIDRRELLRTFDINAVSALMVAQALLRNLKAGSTKLLVNISSDLASISNTSDSGWYAYRCSKVALNMLTRLLSIDLAPAGITVVAVDPGWVRTDMGGPAAPLEAGDSARAMLHTFDSVSAADSGSFLRYDRTRIAW